MSRKILLECNFLSRLFFPLEFAINKFHLQSLEKLTVLIQFPLRTKEKNTLLEFQPLGLGSK